MPTPHNIKTYSPAEERINIISHAVGAALGAAALATAITNKEVSRML